jgi:hypothetical protein
VPGISDVIQWSEYAMAPLSVLAFYYCVRMLTRLVPQYQAARSSIRLPNESEEEHEALLLSTRQELISAGFMVAKVAMLLGLFVLVFAPLWDPLPTNLVKGLVVRIGLDLIIFSMLLHAITRSRYWDELTRIIRVRRTNSSRDLSL